MIDKQKLDAICTAWDRCTLCPISQFTHKHVHYEIVGSDPYVDILFVGEGPGTTEDALGKPFCGDSGRLLREAIVEACQGDDLTYALVNLVACRPTDKIGGRNRQPSAQEIANCAAHLSTLISALQPNIIVYLGRVPQEYGPKTAWEAGFSGPTRNFPHPSYILRQGGKSSAAYATYVTRLTGLVDLAYEMADESAAEVKT